jgi:hypothetical protein
MTTENFKLVKKEEIEEIKLKIETDAEKKILQLNKTSNDYKKGEVENLLLNIIKTGADEFKEKTGRVMSYSEMREMFG